MHGAGRVNCKFFNHTQFSLNIKVLPKRKHKTIHLPNPQQHDFHKLFFEPEKLNETLTTSTSTASEDKGSERVHFDNVLNNHRRSTALWKLISFLSCSTRFLYRECFFQLFS